MHALRPIGLGQDTLDHQGVDVDKHGIRGVDDQSSGQQTIRQKTADAMDAARADLLLQTRMRVLNEDLDDLFRRWYPKFRSQPQTQEPEPKAA